MIEFLLDFAYVGICLALIGRGVGLPIPEDIPLLTAGVLCAGRVCEMEWVLPLAWVSVILADNLSYWAGRLFRTQIPRLPFFRVVLSPPRMFKAETLYQQHGLKGLLAARFTPGFRTPLFFTAGTAGVSFPKFLFTDIPAVLVSASLLIFLGWYFPAKLDLFKELTAAYKWAVLAGAAVTAGALLVYKISKSR